MISMAAAVCGLALAGGFLTWLLLAFDRPGSLTKPLAVVIAPGQSVDDIGRVLANKNVVDHAWVFSLGVRLRGNAAALRSGEYEFGVAFSPRAAMNLILSGKRVARHLLIPDGLTTAQILKLVGNAEGLEGNITLEPKEGSLLPQDYQYFWGDDRDGLIERMAAAHDNALAELWDGRPDSSFLRSPEDAVVLASIIAQETKIPKERAIIASVMANRIKHGMHLESDPTVAYGVARADSLADNVLKRRITRRDIRRPTPYNTYIIKGLPPAPICNPSREAINAALHPAKTNYLFFVSGVEERGNSFSRTLAEHNRNVALMKARRMGETQAQEAAAP